MSKWSLKTCGCSIRVVVSTILTVFTSCKKSHIATSKLKKLDLTKRKNMTSKTKYFALYLIIAHLLSLVDSQYVQYCDMGRAVGDSSMVSELMVSSYTKPCALKTWLLGFQFGPGKTRTSLLVYCGLLEMRNVQWSLVVRKPAFCICENKDADQLRSNCAADQRLCFRCMDSTIPILSKSEISSL